MANFTSIRSRRIPARPAYLVAVAAVMLLAVMLATPLVGDNLSSLAFLTQPTGWSMSSSFFPQQPGDPCWHTFGIGLANNVVVFAICATFATGFGTLIGLCALSINPLLAFAAVAYIKILRGIPLIIQVLFLYAATHQLPGAKLAISPGLGVTLSNKGLFFPAPEHFGYIMLGGCFGALSLALLRVAAGHPLRGKLSRAATVAAAALIGASLTPWSTPTLRGFNFVGGIGIAPEIIALIGGITLYATALTAELVRSGILAVHKGQMEAALSLGMRPAQAMWKVIIPQSLPLIGPAMINMYIYIAKASTFAIAIGVADLFAVSAITINQRGQPFTVLALFTALFVLLCLAISGVGNWANRKIVRQGTRS